MRKIYCLLVMLIVGMLGFSVSAGTRTITIDIDNPNNVVLSQQWDLSNPILLHAGVNTVNLDDPWGYGSSFYIVSNEGVTFTTFTVDGENILGGSDIYESGGRWRYSGYTQGGDTFVIRSASAAPVEMWSATINIDDPSKCSIWSSNNEQVPLGSGSNPHTFNPATANPFRISPSDGEPLYSVKRNGTALSWDGASHCYNIEIHDNDVIDIVTSSSAPTNYTFSWSSGSNLSAVTGVSTTQGQPISGWANGFSVVQGTGILVSFDWDNFDISEISINGEPQIFYEYSPFYVDMSADVEMGVVAAPKAAAANVVTFRLVGWDGNGLVINKGTSSMDSELTLSSEFTDSFTIPEDSEFVQSYFVHTTGDYRVRSIKRGAEGTTNVTVINGGTTIEAAQDGEIFVIEVYKYVDPYPATVSVLANLSYYTGSVTIRNSSGRLSSGIQDGVIKDFKFDPDNSSDNTFVVSATKQLYGVTINGNPVQESQSGSNYVYTMANVADQSMIRIQGVDPSYDPRTEAVLIFDSASDFNAIRGVLINNVEVAASDWQNEDGFTAHVGDRLSIQFVEGYTITDLLFGNNTYNYDSNITTPQPLEWYESTNTYDFNQEVTEDFMPISFTAHRLVVTYSHQVTFNVNIAGGVKLTDVSNSPSSEINMTGTTYIHTFTNEYNYVDIEGAEGYDLVSVTVNPNNGTAAYSLNIPDDKKISSFQVQNGYVLDIEVAEAVVTPPEPEFGTFTVVVNGDPAKVTFMNGSTNMPIALNAGANVIDLYAASCSYIIMPIGEDFESITLNGAPIAKIATFYYPQGIVAGDRIEITTVGAVLPQFTINVSGHASAISSLIDTNYAYYTLEDGENVIDLPNAEDTFMFQLSARDTLYSVKLNGEDVKDTIIGVYYLNVKAGDVVDIETEFPATNGTLNWYFNGCDASIVTSIRIGSEGTRVYADDANFADYFDGYEVRQGTIVTYWLDTTNYNITSVTHNGESQRTSECQNVMVSGDMYISITAEAKRHYPYLLNTNEPQKIRVYEGIYGQGLPVELSGTQTQLEVDEASNKTYITVGTTYGYYFDEDNCKIDGAKLTLGEDGYYTIYPEEYSTIIITVNEVERPNTAVLYIDDASNYNFLSLHGDRFEGGNIADGTAGTGYTTVRFNDVDRSAQGLTLNVMVADESKTPKVYINNVEQPFNAETGMLSGIMLEDGDVIKVFCEEPATHSLNFTQATNDDSKFTITIDQIKEYNPFGGQQRAYSAYATGSIEMHNGTEVKITASEDAHEPWVKVDDEVYSISAGGSHIFNATGNHTVVFGEDFTLTSVEGIIFNVSANSDVYNMQGIRVVSNANLNDIKALQPGMYIIGGKKVLVK